MRWRSSGATLAKTKKQTRVASKQIKATSKRISATAKKSASNKASKKQLRELRNALTVRIQREQKQLAAIEKLLDEDFVSLAQAKRELKRNTVQVKRTTKAAIKTAKSFTKLLSEAFGKQAAKPQKKISPSKTQKSKTPKSQPKKPAQGKSSARISKPKSKPSAVPPSVKPTPKPVTSKPVFSIRPLRGRKGENTIQLFDRLEAMGDSPDSLLKPGERWMFTYGKGRSKGLWGNFADGLRHMRGYQLTEAIVDALHGEAGPDNQAYRDEYNPNLVRSISFTKTAERPKDYADKKEAEEKLRENERRTQQREARRNLEQAGIAQPSIFGGSIDLLAAQGRLLNNPKLLRERIKQLEKKGKMK